MTTCARLPHGGGRPARRPRCCSPCSTGWRHARSWSRPRWLARVMRCPPGRPPSLHSHKRSPPPRPARMPRNALHEPRTTTCRGRLPAWTTTSRLQSPKHATSPRVIRTTAAVPIQPHAPRGPGPGVAAGPARDETPSNRWTRRSRASSQMSFAPLSAHEGRRRATDRESATAAGETVSGNQSRVAPARRHPRHVRSEAAGCNAVVARFA